LGFGLSDQGNKGHTTGTERYEGQKKDDQAHNERSFATAEPLLQLIPNTGGRSNLSWSGAGTGRLERSLFPPSKTHKNLLKLGDKA
jgi:hypothetical protein